MLCSNRVHEKIYVKYHVCDPTWDLKILLVLLVCIPNSIPGISETVGVMANLAAIGSIILPNVGACINGLYFAGQFRKESGTSWYDELKKPAWHPPEWVFGPGWLVLYSAMGYASYLVYEECGGFTEDAVLPLSLYGAQLALNWAWTPILFGLRNFKLAFLGISVLNGAVVATAVSFNHVNKTAGALLLPYLAWLTYASTIVYYMWKNNPEKKD